MLDAVTELAIRDEICALRPDAIREHVERIATNMGAHSVVAHAAGELAVTTFNAQECKSAHRAIRVGVEFASRKTPLKAAPQSDQAFAAAMRDMIPELSLQ